MQLCEPWAFGGTTVRQTKEALRNLSRQKAVEATIMTCHETWTLGRSENLKKRASRKQSRVSLGAPEDASTLSSGCSALSHHKPTSLRSPC